MVAADSHSWDEDEQWESREIPSLLSKEQPLRNSWDDEEDEDETEQLKNNWDDDDEDEQEEGPELAAAAAAQSPVKATKAEQITNAVAADKAEDLVPVDEIDPKSDSSGANGATEKKNLDGFIPKSEGDFVEYSEMVSAKLSNYEKSAFYVTLLKDVVRLSMVGLTAAEAKEIASSVATAANEKLKAEREASGKKSKGKKKNKLQIEHDKSKDAFVASHHTTHGHHTPYDMSDDEDDFI